MFPLLALIPGLLWTGAKYVGPILESHSTQIASKLGDILSDSPTGKKIVDAFESVLGPISDDKKNQFTLELDSMLGQIDVDKIEAQSESRFDSGWRPFLGWGLGSNIVLHYTVVNLIDVVNSLLGLHISQIPGLDPMSLSLMTGILGLYMTARSFEKVKKVN